MSNDIEFLETICERMRQVGLVQSKADFSTRMLGKGPSYLTSMSTRGRKVPGEVMKFLENQLQTDIAADEIALADLSSRHAHYESNRTHRTNMKSLVVRHRANAAGTNVTAETKPPGKTLSIQQKLTGWLTGAGRLSQEQACGVFHPNEA